MTTLIVLVKEQRESTRKRPPLLPLIPFGKASTTHALPTQKISLLRPGFLMATGDGVQEFGVDFHDLVWSLVHQRERGSI